MNESQKKAPRPMEVEAKLLVPTLADLRAVSSLTRLGPYELRPLGAVQLHSTYLDTASLTLARHGVAFRLRRQSRAWEATLKSGGSIDGDVHERQEETLPLPRAPRLPLSSVPAELHAQLAALVAGRPLSPILVTLIHRRRFEIRAAQVAPEQVAPEGEVLAELDLDRVHLRGPQGSVAEITYFEAEIELRGGERGQVVELARWLRRRFHLLPSTESKFSRGLTAFYGKDVIASADTAVMTGDSVQAGLRHIVGRHLYRLRQHDPGTRSGEDPEELHDMRVAARRLRAAVRQFAVGIPARAQGTLNRELKWLGDLLGGVRDLDVQLMKLAHFSASAPAGFRPPLLDLQQHLASERTRRHAQMLARLDTTRYFRLLIRLERFAYGRPARTGGDPRKRESIAMAGRRAIKKTFRSLMKRGERIDTMPHPEDLHALRMRAKRLRYLLEFLHELTGKAGRRLVKRLTAVQDLLGTYHDAVVSAESVRIYVESTGSQSAPAQLVALGALVASELRVAETRRAEFERTWRRFARNRTRDDLRTVLRKLRDAGVKQQASDFAPQTSSSRGLPFAPASEVRAPRPNRMEPGIPVVAPDSTPPRAGSARNASQEQRSVAERAPQLMED